MVETQPPHEAREFERRPAALHPDPETHARPARAPVDIGRDIGKAPDRGAVVKVLAPMLGSGSGFQDREPVGTTRGASSSAPSSASSSGRPCTLIADRDRPDLAPVDIGRDHRQGP